MSPSYATAPLCRKLVYLPEEANPKFSGAPFDDKPRQLVCSRSFNAVDHKNLDCIPPSVQAQAQLLSYRGKH